MNGPVDISPNHLRVVEEILHKNVPPGVAVWVFGSRASWSTSDSSDLDLALEGDIDHDTILALEMAFEESSLPYMVDIIGLDQVSDSFRRIVEAQKVLLLLTNDTPSQNKNWDTVRLGDLISIIRGRSYRSDQLQDNLSTALVTLKSFSRSGGYREDGLKPYIGPYDEDQVVYPSDVIVAQTDITQSGDIIGRPAIIPNNIPYLTLVASLDVAIIKHKPKNNLDPTFLYYRLLADDYVHHAKSHSTGTTVLHMRRDGINKFKFSLPTLNEQRSIAHILKTLDKKIDLNRRMNQTLEAMARALFKSWFMDFDPVHAKMNGTWKQGESLSGLPAYLYEMFPGSMIESELGNIPKGWTTNVFKNCFNLIMGQSPPGNTYNDTGDGLPFFQGSTDFGLRYPKNRKYCTAPRRIAHADDTLISVRAPVGSINMTWEECCAGRGIAVIRHKTNSRSFTYYSAWSLQHDLQQYEQMGTVFGAITKKQFEMLQIVEPPNCLVNCFETYVSAWDERIRLNTLGSRSLTKLRNTLLPKLISGKLRVPHSTRRGRK